MLEFTSESLLPTLVVDGLGCSPICPLPVGVVDAPSTLKVKTCKKI